MADEAGRLIAWRATVLLAESMCVAVRIQIEKRLNELKPKRRKSRLHNPKRRKNG
jgi:hypothetical protein